MAYSSAAALKRGGHTPNGTQTFGEDPASGRTVPPTRATKRNLPLVGLGVLLVVGCAIGFSSAWLRAGGRQDVLVVDTSLAAGQVLSSSDLQTAQLSVARGIASMPASQLSQVIGRPVSTTLTPGTLLTETDVAQMAGPPSGRAEIGLALKPGQYPPGVTPGDRVLVVINAGSSPTSSNFSPTSVASSENAPMEATVIGVESPPADSSESLIVSIQLAEGNGSAVASAASAGNVALAVISSGTSS